MAQQCGLWYNFLMPSRHRRTGFLLILCLAVVAGAYAGRQFQLTGLIPRQPKTLPWKVIEDIDVESGSTIPASTNVVFHLPLTFEKMHRETLLGHKGKTTRYWGYCFPQNYDPAVAKRRRGLPGQIFLSEAERQAQEALLKRKEPSFSLGRLPTKEELALPDRVLGGIRHQFDFFTPGMLCYIQSAGGLTIGLDPDGDKLNDALEDELGTDPAQPDTDADGIWDGVEHLNGTDPFLRDTDSDGLLDGIEDDNWDGDTDRGETDPRVWDSDRDYLCDGWCRVRLKGKSEAFLGEDRNLNGEWDDGETSPLLIDSDNDGVRDEQEFLNCLSTGSTNCPAGG